jgi:small subunit ribosomal protein S20
MPITSSAKKALRASKHKAVFNLKRKDAVSDTVKKIKKLIVAKNIKEAEALMPTAFKAIDKACKTNLIHKNTASRKKSRLAKMLAKASAAK